MTRGYGPGWKCTACGASGEPSQFGNRPPFIVRDPRVDPQVRDQLKAPNGAEVCVCSVELVLAAPPERSRVKVTRKEPGSEDYRVFYFDLAAYRRAVASSSVVYLAGHAVDAG